MNVRELLKHILYYEVVEIRDFEGKNAQVKYEIIIFFILK